MSEVYHGRGEVSSACGAPEKVRLAAGAASRNRRAWHGRQSDFAGGGACSINRHRRHTAAPPACEVRLVALRGVGLSYRFVRDKPDFRQPAGTACPRSPAGRAVRGPGFRIALCATSRTPAGEAQPPAGEGPKPGTPASSCTGASWRTGSTTWNWLPGHLTSSYPALSTQIRPPCA